MNYNYNGDMKYARVVCRRAGIGLVVKPHQQPMTDYKNIYLPPLNPVWDRASPQYARWWFYLLHEAYHNLHMDDPALAKREQIDSQSFLGTVRNIVMDYKIETVNRGEYSGRDALVKEARYRFASENIYRDLGTSDSDPLKSRLAAVWACDAIARISWIPEYAKDDIAGYLGPQGTEWLTKLLSHPTLMNSYTDQKTAEDTYELTLLILKVLELDPNDEKVSKRPQSSAGEGSPPDEAWANFRDMYVDPHEDKKTLPGDTSLNIAYDKEDLNSGMWVPLPFKDIDLDSKSNGNTLTTAQANVKAELEEAMHSCQVTKQIRRELQATIRTRTEFGKKRGRIHKRALHKAAAGSDRVYRKRVQKISPKGTVITLLQDWSGSMGKRKYEAATAATGAMAETLNSLGISFSIEGFSTIGGRYNRSMFMKRFNEKWDSDKYLTRCAMASTNRASNADGDYILRSAGELLKQKAPRKILFVLSDGQPSAFDEHRNKGIPYFTKRVIKSLERTPNFEIYGIGFLTESVKNFYKDYVLVKDPSELEPKLLHVLRNKLVQEEI